MARSRSNRATLTIPSHIAEATLHYDCEVIINPRVLFSKRYEGVFFYEKAVWEVTADHTCIQVIPDWAADGR